MVNQSKFIGIDGCSAGWVSVSLIQDKWNVEIFSNIKELWESHSDAELILIDIPIGLRDEGSNARLCDAEARKLLTRKRSSSVFPTPCRAVLSEDLYELANEKNREMTSKGLSKQAWNITPKIREVDRFLQERSDLNEILIESHPELCFMALAGNNPLSYYKKTQDGITERIEILSSFSKISKDIIDETMKKLDEKRAVTDDVLDAIALAISASYGKDNIRFIPEVYEFDSVGLPMRMAIPNIKDNNQGST